MWVRKCMRQLSDQLNVSWFYICKARTWFISFSINDENCIIMRSFCYLRRRDSNMIALVISCYKYIWLFILFIMSVLHTYDVHCCQWVSSSTWKANCLSKSISSFFLLYHSKTASIQSSYVETFYRISTRYSIKEVSLFNVIIIV